MPCPYFIPTTRFDDAGLPHPSRLPLGAPYRGICGAPGCNHTVPTDNELTQSCNLGYARNCSRLPQDRVADAVRFSILRDRDGQVSLCYIAELNYLPAEQLNLHFDLASQRWTTSHINPLTQALAECFLQSYLSQRTRDAEPLALTAAAL